MTPKENWIAFVIGFGFSTFYVGLMVLWPVVWAFANIAMLVFAVLIKSKLK